MGGQEPIKNSVLRAGFDPNLIIPAGTATNSATEAQELEPLQASALPTELSQDMKLLVNVPQHSLR